MSIFMNNADGYRFLNNGRQKNVKPSLFGERKVNPYVYGHWLELTIALIFFRGLALGRSIFRSLMVSSSEKGKRNKPRVASFVCTHLHLQTYYVRNGQFILPSYRASYGLVPRSRC